jgi:hypothetical protein
MAGTWWPALRARELIAYLTEDELQRLDAVTVPVTAEPGDVIFFKGAPSKSLIIVASRYRGAVAELEPLRAHDLDVSQPEPSQALDVRKAVALPTKDLAEL